MIKLIAGLLCLGLCLTTEVLQIYSSIRKVINDNTLDVYHKIADNPTLSQLIDIEFVCFGDSVESPGYKFECPGDNTNCSYNIVENCANFKIIDQKERNMFIKCFKTALQVVDTFPSIAACSPKWDETIKTCATGQEGLILMHIASYKTSQVDLENGVAYSIGKYQFPKSKIEQRTISTLCSYYNLIGKAVGCASPYLD